MMIFGAVLDVVGIGAVPAFVAALAVPDKVMEIPLVADVLGFLGIGPGTELVVWGAIGMIAVFVAKNFYLYLILATQVRITEHHRVRLATRLFAAYVRAPWEFHLRRNSSELLRNVYSETLEIISGVINPLMSFMMNAIMTLLTVVLLLALTPGVAVFGLAFVGGASWLFLRIFQGRLARYGVEAKEERKQMIQAVTQSIGALTDVRVLGREAYFVESFRRSVANFARVFRLNEVIKKTSPYVLEMVAVTGLLGIVLVLVLLGRNTATLVPMLALYGAAIVRLRQSIGQMVSNISQMQFSGAAIPIIVRDYELLEQSIREHENQASTVEPIPFSDNIEISDITYAYPDSDRPALENISLTIRRGQSVAFVGSTGSGKSTLINVLLGFLKPEKGQIMVDGKDIHDNLPGWLKHIGYIPQTIVLLDDSIRRNVAFGIRDEDIDDAQVDMAIAAAQLTEFIESLPEGLETVVGERGVRLSGGQRQRVGLARALYHNPDILVMDEATSSLDNQTENLVMKALEELKANRTFIMIAHRLSTVNQCDRLYFLKDGRIEADGTYEELKTVHEEFQRMAEIV